MAFSSACQRAQAEISSTVGVPAAENVWPFNRCVIQMSSSGRQVQKPLGSIARLIRNSRRIVRNSCVDVRVSKTSRPRGQLIIVVPRRSGTAVERNTFKRRTRAIFRERKLAETGFDWVFFARSSAGSCSYAHLLAVVDTALSTLSSSFSSASS